MPDISTDLIIVGAGAGGLMAAAMAGERGVRSVLIERKHQPGRKLLMCANNKCNLTNDLTAKEMIEAYGHPVGDFLAPSINALPPVELREWFKKRGLPTRVHKDGKVFPHSEKSADVLRFFGDTLRVHRVPTVFNAAITGIVRQKSSGALLVTSDNFSLSARCVILATGGVSYPKTGSVGDGQKMAGKLGHRLVPYRAGLVGCEVAENWLAGCGKGSLPGTMISVAADGNVVGRAFGEIEFSHQGIRGAAVVDASRLAARANTGRIEFRVDLCPRLSVTDLAAVILKKQGEAKDGFWQVLADWLMSAELAQQFVRHAPAGACRDSMALAKLLKNWVLHPTKLRPLKEAMVTVGGIALDQIDPHTMQSTLVPGLFFCGEVMDVDGPTGGFNLHAAFATAQQAVNAITSIRQNKCDKSR